MGRYEIVKGRDDQFRFCLRAGNGEIVTASVSFQTEEICRAALEVSRRISASEIEDQTSPKCVTLDCPKYEIYSDKAGEFRFRLKDKKGNTLCISEGYRSKRSCQNGIASVAKNAPDAPVVSYIN